MIQSRTVWKANGKADIVFCTFRYQRRLYYFRGRGTRKTVPSPVERIWWAILYACFVFSYTTREECKSCFIWIVWISYSLKVFCII